MKADKFIECDTQFRLGGIRYPVLGGPGSCAYPIYGNGVTYEDMLAKMAKQVEYVAVLPFESLDLQATNVFQLHKRMAKWHVEDTLTFNKRHVTIYPRFQGDGHVYMLIGSAGWRTMDERCSSNWSAVDQQTPLLEVIRRVKAEYDGRKLEHFERWALDFVMKIGWKAADHKRYSYDIFVPAEDFRKEHGVEIKPRQLSAYGQYEREEAKRRRDLIQFAREVAGT